MHVGFIMDGNRRWAKKGGFLPYLGHNMGGETLEKILEVCPKYEIDIVTIYALSTENLVNRSAIELKALMELLKSMALTKKDKLAKGGIKVKIVGDISPFPESTKNALLELVETTKDGQNSILQICLNYGGKQEILDAVKKTIAAGLELNQENVTKNLGADGEPELIIRTGGAQRISNFLLWQGAYSEYFFSDKLWPEFGETELIEALDFYKQQVRNFGK